MASAFWRRVTVVVDIASQALARSGVGAEFRCLGFSCGGGDDGDGGDSGDGGDGDDGTGAAKNRTPLW